MSGAKRVAVVNTDDQWARRLCIDFREEGGGSAFAPTIVLTVESALEWVGDGGVVCFLTTIMQEEAERVAHEHPNITVVILTGGQMRGLHKEVFYVAKSGKASYDCIAIALRSR